MAKQTPEDWHDIESTNEIAVVETSTPYAQVVNDPVQRRAVEKALMMHHDVDPRIVRAMGMGVAQKVVEAQEVSSVATQPMIRYSGAEGEKDLPAVVVVPNSWRAHLPA